MTAREPKTGNNPGPRGQETAAEPSHEAEHEQDVVSEAKPAERLTAEAVAQDLADHYADTARADGNRITVTFEGPNGLVQTFHATVEEGIREF